MFEGKVSILREISAAGLNFIQTRGFVYQPIKCDMESSLTLVLS